MWIAFNLAAEEVERRLGVSWGMAQKVLLEGRRLLIAHGNNTKLKKRKSESWRSAPVTEAPVILIG